MIEASGRNINTNRANIKMFLKWINSVEKGKGWILLKGLFRRYATYKLRILGHLQLSYRESDFIFKLRILEIC